MEERSLTLRILQGKSTLKQNFNSESKTNSLYEVLKLKQNFRKTKVVTGKTQFFVKGPSCTPYSICLTLAPDKSVLYGESAKLRGLRGLVGGVGAWVTWVENLRGSRGLRGSIKFWREWRGSMILLYWKVIIKNFAKFRGKHLCWSL